MRLALQASIQPVQSDDLRRWVLLEDDVLSRQAALTMGAEGLQQLAKEFAAKSLHFEAGKATFVLSFLKAGDYVHRAAVLVSASVHD